MTDRRTTLTLEVTDKFSTALNNFAAGMDKSAEAMKRTSTTATKLTEVSQKVDDVGKKSQSMSDRLQTAFGGSSRAVNVFGNALGNAVGLSGEFGYTLDVLMDSGAKAALQFGAMTAGAVALGKTVEEANRLHAEMADKITETAVRYAVAAGSIDEMTQALIRQQDEIVKNQKVFGLLPANMMQEDAWGLAGAAQQRAMEELAKKTREQLETQRLSARAQGDSKAMAELQLDVERKRAQALQDEVRAIMDATKTRLDYINSSRSSLRQIGGGFTNEEMMGLYETGSYNVPGQDKSRMDVFLEGQQRQRDQQDKARGDAEQRARAQESILRQTQSRAFSLYKSIADGGDKTAAQISASFADAFVSIIDAEAELNNNSSLSMIQLQQVFGKAFDGMSSDMVGKLLGVMDAGGAMAQSLISQLYAIAAGGGTAAEQIEAIRAALAGLPTDKFINIHLNYKASGPGGNQQGDEWNFTLEGEAYGVRKAYMDKYGDYGRANDAWQADHRGELNDKGVTGPGQANTRTGEVYQYAYGEHSIVTSPRMMLVGERGPERVDITPGTGARGGGGGGSVTVNFNSLVPPNEFEVRQLAAKLKSYMRI